MLKSPVVTIKNKSASVFHKRGISIGVPINYKQNYLFNFVHSKLQNSL